MGPSSAIASALDSADPVFHVPSLAPLVTDVDSPVAARNTA